MPIPNQNITPIPNTEPDAVPALWNARYEEIDENFAYLAEKAEKSEKDLLSAAGDSESLAERLDDLSDGLAQVSPESISELSAAVEQSLNGVAQLKGLIQQEGEVTLTNRGVVSGCVVAKSVAATRNLDLSAGVGFISGRMYSAPSATNAASVPQNLTDSAVAVKAYLYLHSSNQLRLAVTNIDQALPQSAIHICNITIPAGSTDASDPQLESVTITSVARSEPNYPRSLISPSQSAVEIATLTAADYRVDMDVASYTGGCCSADQVIVSSRATNGFVVSLASDVDDVVVRWR
ncbi:MAG: hypothetical protein ACRDBT_08400, partial [Aeromonas sp.]